MMAHIHLLLAHRIYIACLFYAIYVLNKFYFYLHFLNTTKIEKGHLYILHKYNVPAENKVSATPKTSVDGSVGNHLNE